jgi:hypothetical protein
MKRAGPPRKVTRKTKLTPKRKGAPKKRAAKKPYVPTVTPAVRARARKILARLERAYPDWGPTLEFADPLQLLVATILAAQAADLSIVERDADAPRRLRTVPEHERAHRDVQIVAALGEPARFTIFSAVAVAELAQLVLDVAGRDAQAGMDLERSGVDARRQGEAASLEFLLHAQVQVQDEGEKHRDAGEHRVGEISYDCPSENSATRHVAILASQRLITCRSNAQ